MEDLKINLEEIEQLVKIMELEQKIAPESQAGFLD